MRRVVLAAGSLLLLGNAAILLLVHLARRRSHPCLRPVRGIRHVRVADDRLWRGTAPSAEGYEALAEAGVTTVVDLRPEAPDATASVAGMRVVHLPVTDGHAPPPEVVDRFLDAVAASEGPAYVHCSAGVGRTGTLVADRLVRSGVEPLVALRENLAVGPPSLEQIAYVLLARTDGVPRRPGALLTALSRYLDAPRRLWRAIG